MGAKVVRHQSSFEDVFRKGYGDDFDKYSGHWLRVDLPSIEVDDDIVLYTDVDVMFVGQPIIRQTPRYLAAAPETYRWRYPHFNSGVMILNLVALRQVHHTFVATIESRMAKGWRPPGHDQVSYNKFFRWRYTPMRSRMNWKPYWGANPDARIVHFHGPKPHNIRFLEAGTHANMLPIYRRLWQKNRAAYSHYCAEFESYLR